MQGEEVVSAVKERYGKIAKEGASCGCCSPKGPATAETISRAVGYTEAQMGEAPEGANLGLGCGNPVAIASLKEGEVVLDLGSGAGFDAFLAANRVGPAGKVIGVDMTEEMLARARENAKKGGFANVEFRLGRIESLPVEDASVDVVISNCVINLSIDKKKVFAETFRALKPGGRVMVSDLVLRKELPEAIRNSIQAYTGCIAGALMKNDYLDAVRAAGFESIEVVDETTYPLEWLADEPTVKDFLGNAALGVEDARAISDAVASVKIAAVKPRAGV